MNPRKRRHAKRRQQQARDDARFRQQLWNWRHSGLQVYTDQDILEMKLAYARSIAAERGIRG